MSSSAHSLFTAPRLTGFLLLCLLIGAYFIWDSVPRFLIWTEESYGAYFWPRANYVLPHVLGGVLALLIGPLQFWPHLRNTFPRIHRSCGRVYLSAVLLAGAAAFALAFTSAVNYAYTAGLASLGIAWLGTSAMALLAIKKRNFLQHKEWMIRSYVVTFAFVIFRISDDLLSHFGLGDRLMNLTALSWLCWAVPLLFAEMIIQGRKISVGRG